MTNKEHIERLEAKLKTLKEIDITAPPLGGLIKNLDEQIAFIEKTIKRLKQLEGEK